VSTSQRANRLLLGAALAAAAALAVAPSGGATFPGVNGRIVFASARPDQPGEGNSEIYELDLASGQSRDVSRTTAYDDSALAASPDGTRIAFARAPISNPDADPNVNLAPRPRIQLWVMNRDGSDQHRLGNVDFYHVGDFAWSGDGTSIAFLAASGTNTANHLWVVDADGSGLRESTTFPTANARWSPDGSELAFVGWNDPEWHIGVTNADGTGLRWLPTSPDTAVVAGATPAWSPDGKKLAFFESGGSSAEALVLANADGSGPRTLLTSAALMSDLQWLRSGEIGFLERDGTDRRESTSHVELIGPDGTGLRTVAGVTSPVAWAPSGDRLAFVRPTPRRELVVDSLDGPERVLPLPGLLARVGNEQAGGPVWSPSSASLYVAGTVAYADTELYSISLQGGDLLQLTHNKVNDVDPAWSPNGQQIAFVRETSDRRGYLLTCLWVMDADGSHLRRLTKPGSDSSPSWAPDNAHLVFSRDGRGLWEIAVLNTRTGRIRPLASNAQAPAWSPDGRLIAYVTGGRRPLRLIRPDGSAVRSLLDRSDLEPGTRFWPILQPSWSPDGQQVAFTLFFYGKLSSYAQRQFVVPRKGGKPRELSCGPSSAPPGLVRWSPDGTALVASSGGEVWICPLNGSATYRLSDGTDPDWQSQR
jgi:Tol biopolymer transport system component